MTQLTDEEIKKLNPKLTPMNGPGGSQGEPIPITNGSTVPGYIQGFRDSETNLPISTDGPQTKLITATAPNNLVRPTKPQTAPIRVQQNVQLPSSMPTRIMLGSAGNGQATAVNTGPVRLKFVTDSSGQRRLVPDMGPASDQN